MVMATQPLEYAMEPHTTKVPAEKKLINRERPLIHQGSAPPAAKNDFMFLPDFEKLSPHTKTSKVKISITVISIVPILKMNILLTLIFCNLEIGGELKPPI